MCVEINRDEAQQEVMGCVKRQTGKQCVKQTAKPQTFPYVLPWPIRGQL